jgi:hypothetical protein
MIVEFDNGKTISEYGVRYDQQFFPNLNTAFILLIFYIKS